MGVTFPKEDDATKRTKDTLIRTRILSDQLQRSAEVCRLAAELCQSPS